MAKSYMILLMFGASCLSGIVVMQKIRGSVNVADREWAAVLLNHIDRSQLVDKHEANSTVESGASPDASRSSIPATHATANQQRDWKTNQVVRLKTGTEVIVGRVLAWDDTQVALLSDRGALRYIPWSVPTEIYEEAGDLQPLPAANLQSELQAEFGSEFVVRASAQFVVVQPKNCQRDWARSMQQFYGNVQTYCSARQIPLKHPPFPMVAIVLPNRQAMIEYAAQQQDRIGNHFLAYYSLNSNRVLMYDSSRKGTESHGPLELATVFHEAFHQVAFNAGLHKRTAAPPLWVSEGMASAFETPGMADHRRSKTISDRVHPDHLRLFLELANNKDFSRTLGQLIEHDAMFQTDANQAYAISWAMAFYWMEHAPHAFAEYLKTTNQRAAFVDQDPQRRLREFRSLAPTSIEEFAARLKNYFERL